MDPKRITFVRELITWIIMVTTYKPILRRNDETNHKIINCQLTRYNIYSYFLMQVSIRRTCFGTERKDRDFQT